MLHRHYRKTDTRVMSVYGATCNAVVVERRPCPPARGWGEPVLIARARQTMQRDRRLALLLVGIWIVNSFDWGFTVLAMEQRLLFEANPLVARLLMPCGPLALASYKIVLLTFATAIFWRYRRHWLVEGAVWIIALACVILSIYWHELYREAQPFWSEYGLSKEIVPPELWRMDLSVALKSP